MRTTSRPIRLVAALIMATLALATLPSLASAATADIWAWATVRDPGRSWQEITGKDSASSSGKKITVKRLAKGYHRVRFGGFSTTKAHFQVTPLSGVGEMCTYYGTGTLTGATEAYVNCRNRYGQPKDVKFMVSMLQSWTEHTGPRLAYLWAHMPKSAAYPSHPDYYFSSIGKNVMIQRLGLGEYRVRFDSLKELGGGGGSIQVTAFGTKRHVCRVASIGPDKYDLVVVIRCRNANGAAVDAKFNLLYHEDEGLKGAGGDSWAYLYADQPTSKWYVPALFSRDSSPAGTPSVKRAEKGRYLVKLPSMPLGGAVQVTAVDGWKRCHVSKVRKTDKPQRVEVRCFKSKGNVPGDARFMLSYER